MGLWAKGIKRSRSILGNERLENVNPYDKYLKIGDTEFFVKYKGDCQIEIFDGTKELMGIYMLQPRRVSRYTNHIDTIGGPDMCITSVLTFTDDRTGVLFSKPDFKMKVLNIVNNWLNSL